MNVPDNYDRWEQHEAECEAWLKKQPICAECGEHIQDDYCYEINDELVCENCMEMNHKKWTEYYTDI